MHYPGGIFGWPNCPFHRRIWRFSGEERKMDMISPEQVKYIAHLARLDIEEQKLDGYSSSLSTILDLVDQLGEANTQGISPMAHPMSAIQPQRPDKVTEEDFSKELQDIAIDLEANLVLVPQVIE